MIEYCEDKIYKARILKRGKRCIRRGRRFFLFFLFSILLVGLVLYYKYVVTDEVIAILFARSKSYSVMSVNSAVLESIESKIDYEDIVSVEKNAEGDIVLISSNPIKVNRINREVAEKSQEKLTESLKKGVEIPLLAFSGIKLLSGYGPNVNYKAITVSSVICNFASQFESVGINQTLHSIYLSVETTVDVAMPLLKESVKTQTSVLISEAVLVGKIPSVYLSGGAEILR